MKKTFTLICAFAFSSLLLSAQNNSDSERKLLDNIKLEESKPVKEINTIGNRKKTDEKTEEKITKKDAISEKNYEKEFSKAKNKKTWLKKHHKRAQWLAKHPKAAKWCKKHPAMAKWISENPNTARFIYNNPDMAKYIKNHQKFKNRAAKAKKKWDNATPGQREAFTKRLEGKRGDRSQRLRENAGKTERKSEQLRKRDKHKAADALKKKSDKMKRKSERIRKQDRKTQRGLNKRRSGTGRKGR